MVQPDLPMTTYIPHITEAIAKAADKAAAKHNADITQMLVSSSVFVAGMIFANYAHDADQLENAMTVHTESVRNFVADMIKKQAPGG